MTPSAEEWFRAAAYIWTTRGAERLKKLATELAKLRLPQPPEVVCLCGSTKFMEEYRMEERRLAAENKIVLGPAFFGHQEPGFDWDLKIKLDELHLRKIDLADRIHVINVNGYIGESTRQEIAYAVQEKKDITYLLHPGLCNDVTTE